MLEDILSSLNSLIPTVAPVSKLPAESLPIPYICAILGGLILSRFTGSLGNVTLPFNISAMFIGSMLSNWLLQGVQLPLDPGLQRPLFVTLLGMTVVSVIVMLFVQKENRHA
ncbi:hypothetical protein [Aestuariivirga sp.]|uniref:hypothetical protein n=1 Tax=Aestuariivirga sp. TaxID=2650926 RepID=UPI0039E54723